MGIASGNGFVYGYLDEFWRLLNGYMGSDVRGTEFIDQIARAGPVLTRKR